jgi:sporulation protein YtfJ
VSKVSFGFASGGSDFATKNQPAGANNPFGGGSGAGVNITPIAFLVIKDGNVRLVNVAPTEHSAVDNIIEMVPEVVDKVSGMINKKKQAKASREDSTDQQE